MDYGIRLNCCFITNFKFIIGTVIFSFLLCSLTFLFSLPVIAGSNISDLQERKEKLNYELQFEKAFDGTLNYAKDKIKELQLANSDAGRGLRNIANFFSDGKSEKKINEEIAKVNSKLEPFFKVDEKGNLQWGSALQMLGLPAQFNSGGINVLTPESAEAVINGWQQKNRERMEETKSELEKVEQGLVAEESGEGTHDLDEGNNGDEQPPKPPVEEEVAKDDPNEEEEYFEDLGESDSDHEPPPSPPVDDDQVAEEPEKPNEFFEEVGEDDSDQEPPPSPPVEEDVAEDDANEYFEELGESEASNTADNSYDQSGNLCSTLLAQFNATYNIEHMQAILQQAQNCSWYGAGVAALQNQIAYYNEQNQRQQQYQQQQAVQPGALTIFPNPFPNPYAKPPSPESWRPNQVPGATDLTRFDWQKAAAESRANPPPRNVKPSSTGNKPSKPTEKPAQGTENPSQNQCEEGIDIYECLTGKKWPASMKNEPINIRENF